MVQTSRGAPPATPNHLGASSKSNKRELPDGNASSALRRMWLLTLGQGLKLNHKSSSHPSPCLDSLKDLALLGFGRVFWKLEDELCSWRVSSASWKGEGVYIEAPQKLAVVEVLCACRNFRHRVGTSDQFKFTQLRGFYRKLLGISEGRVGTSDPCIFSWPRTLCRTKQDTSDGGSELPTPTENFRISVKLCIVSWFCLLASNLDTIASPDRNFASLLIVRCFLYSNSKIEINKTRQRSSCTDILANMASILALFNFNDFKSCS